MFQCLLQSFIEGHNRCVCEVLLGSLTAVGMMSTGKSNLHGGERWLEGHKRLQYEGNKLKEQCY